MAPLIVKTIVVGVASDPDFASYEFSFHFKVIL